MDALGKEGSLVSLKDAFEKLSGQAPLNSSNEMTTFSVNTEEGLDKSKVCSEKIARESHSPSPGALFVLELYAVLPAAAQLRLFEGVKEGKRLVVVATNVVETSLTIPSMWLILQGKRRRIMTPLMAWRHMKCNG